MNKYIDSKPVCDVNLQWNLSSFLDTHKRKKNNGVALRNWLIMEANAYSVTFRHFPV